VILNLKFGVATLPSLLSVRRTQDDEQHVLLTTLHPFDGARPRICSKIYDTEARRMPAGVAPPHRWLSWIDYDKSMNNIWTCMWDRDLNMIGVKNSHAGVQVKLEVVFYSRFIRTFRVPNWTNLTHPHVYPNHRPCKISSEISSWQTSHDVSGEAGRLGPLALITRESPTVPSTSEALVRRSYLELLRSKVWLAA